MGREREALRKIVQRRSGNAGGHECGCEVLYMVFLYMAPYENKFARRWSNAVGEAGILEEIQQ